MADEFWKKRVAELEARAKAAEAEDTKAVPNENDLDENFCPECDLLHDGDCETPKAQNNT